MHNQFGYQPGRTPAPRPQPSSPARRASDRVLSAAGTTGGFLVLIWVLQFINAFSGQRLLAFGIRPRDVEGMWGILFAPFLHANFVHLIANTTMAAILLFLVALSGTRAVVTSSVVTILVGGFGVWFFGQPYSVHVGSSILIYGWLAFLIVRGFFSGRIWQILLGIILAFAYSGMLWGVLPGQYGVSWEGHLFGAAGGVVAGWMNAGQARAERHKERAMIAR